MKFSIITPTLLRPSLEACCRSIDEQSFTDWEHIVVCDRPNADYYDLQAGIRGDQRRSEVICERAHHNYGNSCRHNVYPHARGDYILRLDDDEVFASNAFTILSDFLDSTNADLVVFPGRRLGKRFFNLPPGLGRTMNCQFAHRRGPVFPDIPNYEADGIFLEEIMKTWKPMALDIPEELVIVDKVSWGKP